MQFGMRQWLVIALGMAGAVSGGAQVRRSGRVKPVAGAPRATVAQIDQGKTYGVKSAPVRIDEFSDFECPACRALYMETLRQLIDQDVSRGTVYLVVHDFPLQMHPYSHQAAYYADGAAAIGRFGAVELALFTHQPEWAANGKIQPYLAAALSPTELKQVEELSRTKEVQDAVQADVQLGQQANVRQTPTMFVTYKGRRTPLVGVISYSILHNYISALLQQ